MYFNVCFLVLFLGQFSYSCVFSFMCFFLSFLKITIFHTYGSHIRFCARYYREENTRLCPPLLSCFQLFYVNCQSQEMYFLIQARGLVYIQLIFILNTLA